MGKAVTGIVFQSMWSHMRMSLSLEHFHTKILTALTVCSGRTFTPSVIDLIYTVLCPSVSNTWHLVNPNVVFVPGGEGTAAQRSACGWFPCMSCSARPTSYADQCSLLEMIFLSLLCMIEYCSIGAWMSHIFLHDPNTSWSCGQLRF